MAVATPGDVATETLSVTRDLIEAYASLTGDDNPLHLDETYAASGLFDGTIAHGMLSAGVISAALAALPGDIIYVAQDLQFEAPVYPGETVSATVEVVESLDGGRLRVETVAETEVNTVITGEAVVLSLAHDG